MYAKLLAGGDHPQPLWDTTDQGAVHSLLVGCAAEFAARCRAAPNPKFPKDATRRPMLRYGRGLGADEAAAFMRALRSELVIVEADGHFLVPDARACSVNLHLVGRNEDHVALHTEVLVHLGAYAELLLDHDWTPDRLVFDPFISGAALDLWGFAEPPRPAQPWWEGRIVFTAEAKARTAGADSLASLARAFDQLQSDPSAVIDPGQLRKWHELVRIVGEHGPVSLLLVADSARWWYDAIPGPDGVRLTRRLA
jgi:hypothetical protein